MYVKMKGAGKQDLNFSANSRCFSLFSRDNYVLSTGCGKSLYFAVLPWVFNMFVKSIVIIILLII